MRLNGPLLKSLIKALRDSIVVIGCLWLAIFTSEELRWTAEANRAFFSSWFLVFATYHVVMVVRKTYRINPRYIGLYDFINLTGACIAASIAFGVFHWARPGVDIHASAPFLLCFYMISAIIGMRVVLRLYSWRQIPFRIVPHDVKPVRTLIVGAGDAGEMMIRQIQKSRDNRRVINGLVDDDPAKRTLIIQGVRVIGESVDIPKLVKSLQIDEIVLALPSAMGDDMRRIVGICNSTTARVRTLPSVTNLLDTSPSLPHQLRDVQIEDLLRREPARADAKLLASYLGGESVLITGGGGSIGAELARQAARLSPGNLVLVGKGENSIYEVEQELIHTTAIEPCAVIADIRDRRSMEAVFEKYMPSIVFHAAAHKHVPLMQSNPIEAIRNNVFGTIQMAELAIKYGAKRFVYISTDKAVNPSSVMGATKRVGEMIVSALAQRCETSFGVVRFGNVLGSRGSLIPLLENQIRRGGPLRITHSEMTRYFMTIPEAVQLILQAGSAGRTGELFILDMGEPVRIMDIARDLIRLHGLTPDRDIEIKQVGIRPGEKLHEELVYRQEELIATDHPKISMAKSAPVDWVWLREQLNILERICESGDQQKARQFLMELSLGKSSFGVVQMEGSPTQVEN